MESQEELLSTICELPLLEHWRTLLRASPHVAHGWPWWLDGSLAAAAARVAQDARRDVVLFHLGPAEAARAAASGAVWTAPLAPALAASSATAFPLAQRLRWRLAEGAYLAILDLPATRQSSGETTVRIRFYETDAAGSHTRAVHLDLSGVRLAGVAAWATRPAEADFVWEELAQAATLVVAGRAWELFADVGRMMRAE